MTINYDWDEVEDNIVEEYDDAGVTVAEYTTEPSVFGNVVSQRRNGQDSVYHYDSQGSTIALTDAHGDVTDTYLYSSFGELTARTGSTTNPFQYIGQEGYYWDFETGEYDVRRRVMSTPRGSWLSIGPLVQHAIATPMSTLGSLTSMTSYAYAEQCPVLFADPSGLLNCKQIQEGDLQYSCNCGWIDWSHAKPWGKLIAEWKSLIGGTGLPSLLGGGTRFCVDITQKFLGVAVFSPPVACYYVKTGMTNPEYESVALAIYQDAQSRFEIYQGKTSWWSSFACEDLPSDVIQFYLSIGKIGRDQVSTICDIETNRQVNSELCKYSKCVGCPQVKKWPPAGSPFYIAPLYIKPGCPCVVDKYPCYFANKTWPSELSSITPAPKGILWRDWWLKELAGLATVPLRPTYDEYRRGPHRSPGIGL